jgi:hypothetical protein
VLQVPQELEEQLELLALQVFQEPQVLLVLQAL